MQPPAQPGDGRCGYVLRARVVSPFLQAESFSFFTTESIYA